MQVNPQLKHEIKLELIFIFQACSALLLVIFLKRTILGRFTQNWGWIVAPTGCTAGPLLSPTTPCSSWKVLASSFQRWLSFLLILFCCCCCCINMLPPLQSNVFFLVGVQQFILSQIYGMTENPNNNANYFNPAQGHGRRSIHCLFSRSWSQS